MPVMLRIKDTVFVLVDCPFGTGLFNFTDRTDSAY